MDAAGSMAPATWGLKPAFFIMGMVNIPVNRTKRITRKFAYDLTHIRQKNKVPGEDR